MALSGKFVLNDADYSPFTLYGIGTFMAHSGNGVYRNHGGCSAVPDNGPIPPGKYWIVDRGEGGAFGRLNALVRDTVNRTFYGAQFKHSDWFALYRDDRGIDDTTWINGVSRGLFRLHPGTLSKGCITIANSSDFAMIRNALMRTPLVQVPCMRSLRARGWVEVISNGKTCP